MRTRLLRPALVPLGAVIVLATACADSSSTGVTGSNPAPTTTANDPRASLEPVIIEIEGSRFADVERTVEVGTTVVFRNLDPFDHTVTSAEDAPFEFGSDLMSQGDEFAIVFDEPGEYPYFCVVHPTMRGVIAVVG